MLCILLGGFALNKCMHCQNLPGGTLRLPTLLYVEFTLKEKSKHT